MTNINALRRFVGFVGFVRFRQTRRTKQQVSGLSGFPIGNPTPYAFPDAPEM